MASRVVQAVIRGAKTAARSQFAVQVSCCPVLPTIRDYLPNRWLRNHKAASHFGGDGRRQSVSECVPTGGSEPFGGFPRWWTSAPVRCTDTVRSHRTLIPCLSCPFVSNLLLTHVTHFGHQRHIGFVFIPTCTSHHRPAVTILPRQRTQDASGTFPRPRPSRRSG